MKKRLFVTLTLGLAVGLSGFAYAAETMDPARLQVIAQQCTALQTNIDQLQRRDLVARTNRGREYESMIMQLNALIQRLQHNNISTATLDAPLGNFKSVIDAFRAGYVQYDNSMNILRQIDCRNKPAEFAVALEQTRIMRLEVGAEVAKGDQYLAEFRQAAVDLQAQLPPGSK